MEQDTETREEIKDTLGESKDAPKKTKEVKDPKPTSKIVRLVAVDNNPGANAYRSRPYQTTPIWSISKGKYLTGYEDEKGFAQIKTRERTLKIDPEEHYPVSHMQKLDLSQLKDQYFLDYLKTQPRIAQSKAEADARPNFFYFYIEDRQKQAEVSLSSADQKFEAEMEVRNNLAQADYPDLGIWMGADVTLLTDLQLKNYLIGENGVCKTRSVEVLDFFRKTNAEILFVRKLAFHKIIYKDSRGRGYYDDPGLKIFLGMTEGEVVSFMQKEDKKPYLNKWRETLKDKK